MSQYQKLDTLILNKIGGHPQKFIDIYVRDVSAECRRIAEEAGGDAYRVLDRRLQALRKSGRIQYAGKGWIKAAEAA